MELDERFKCLENILNLSQPLNDWFLRNQEEMLYYQMFHRNSTRYYENEYCNCDIIILEKMTNACFSWLESPKTLSISNKKKADYATLSIAGIYEKEKEKLSAEARTKYMILELEKEKKLIKKR